MKRVKIAELKNQLSRHLRSVERGTEIEVTDRDRPIARIVPVPESGPLLKTIPPKRPFAEVRDVRYRRLRSPIDLVRLLLEDRRGR